MAHASIYSTVTGKLDTFNAETRAKKITLYVCGVTPYDDAHIGHGRCYVTFDILLRMLRASGFEVVYCRNVTDIDDKLLRRAEQELGDQREYGTIARRYTKRFQEDVARLGCLPPTYEPRVTDHIAEIIAFIAGLIERGHAYLVNGSVYFRVKSYPAYGTLSRQSIDDLQSGSRIAVAEEKEDPLDFALWKAEPDHSFWQSPWGWGRPGWHIECSALARQFLGHPIDIHGGGMDLLFPHHENERAQSESLLGSPFVCSWMHNAFVRVKQEKMSKSLGNFISLRQAFETVDPMVLRYYYAINHYRNPLDFCWDDIAAAAKSYQRLVGWYGSYEPLSYDQLRDLVARAQEGGGGAALQRAVTFLCTDLNVQGMLGVVFEQHASWDEATRRCVASLLTEVCGFSLRAEERAPVKTPEIERLIAERAEARSQRDWSRADALREQLRLLGWEVRDGASPAER